MAGRQGPKQDSNGPPYLLGLLVLLAGCALIFITGFHLGGWGSKTVIKNEICPAVEYCKKICGEGKVLMQSSVGQDLPPNCKCKVKEK